MIERVRSILPIPDAPIDIDESSLVDVQKRLRLEFPADFLEFARTYGSGTIVIDDTYDFEVYSSARPSFEQFIDTFITRQDRYRKATGNDNVPLGLFPEEGGLVPFGHRDDVYFTWKTTGHPNDWTTVVIWQFESGGYQEFPLGFCDFLTEFLLGRLQVEPFKATWDAEAEIAFEAEVYGG